MSSIADTLTGFLTSYLCKFARSEIVIFQIVAVERRTEFWVEEVRHDHQTPLSQDLLAHVQTHHDHLQICPDHQTLLVDVAALFEEWQQPVQPPLQHPPEVLRRAFSNALFCETINTDQWRKLERLCQMGTHLFGAMEQE